MIAPILSLISDLGNIFVSKSPDEGEVPWLGWRECFLLS